MFEVEMKFKVNDANQLISKMRMLDIELNDIGMQRDIIFVSNETKGFNIKPGSPVLRIRHESSSISLTLKRKITLDHSVEHELYIQDSIEMTNILEALGLKKLVEVVKKRSTAKKGDVTYCLDNVNDIGFFLEIEILVEQSADVGIAKSKIMDCAKSLGLSEIDIEKRKYDVLVYNFNERKNMEIV